MESCIYFVGAGGIGISNLVRYYLSRGVTIAGYDRTSTELTDALISEGVSLVFEDNPNLIPENFRNPANTLVVYTPAVPDSNHILSWFRSNGFEVIKRAALLGKITQHSRAICVAGSHGKTTVSSMIAYILEKSGIGCNAFIGGILRNTGTNLILSESSPWSIIEADEYDRSFHHLSPEIAIVTSTDPDHIDIYGNEENYLESFAYFTSLIHCGGFLISRTGIKLHPNTQSGVECLSYSSNPKDTADFKADNIRISNGCLLFDFISSECRITDIELGTPVRINVENAVAAIAASLKAGASPENIRIALKSFLGAKRRFEIWYRTPEDSCVLLDDYAHSPAEISATIASVRALWPGKHLSIIFQPHLYTRTRDFADGFAQALSAADRVYLCEIYPAREEPIPGVTSRIIYDALESKEKFLVARKDLLYIVKNTNFEILMTMGAADINLLLPELAKLLAARK